VISSAVPFRKSPACGWIPNRRRVIVFVHNENGSFRNHGSGRILSGHLRSTEKPISRKPIEIVFAVCQSTKSPNPHKERPCKPLSLRRTQHHRPEPSKAFYSKLFDCNSKTSQAWAWTTPSSKTATLTDQLKTGSPKTNRDTLPRSSPVTSASRRKSKLPDARGRTSTTRRVCTLIVRIPKRNSPADPRPESAAPPHNPLSSLLDRKKPKPPPVSIHPIIAIPPPIPTLRRKLPDPYA